MTLTSRIRWFSLCSTILLAHGAFASSFEDALTAAYETNPRIKSERAHLQSTDESIAQAMSGFRPTLNAEYQDGRQKVSSTGTAATHSDYTDKTLTLSQPLFRGGGTFAALNSARQRVKAGEFDLFALEQQVLLDAVTAYMDVVSNRSILDLSRKNEAVFTEQLKAVNTRFKVGEVTRTDVAQAQSSLSDAHASVIAAESQLVASSATFERVIGYKPPATLEIPDALPTLPASLEEALEGARQKNPQFLASLHTAKSSRYDTYSTEAALLPSVSLVGSLSRTEGGGTLGTSSLNEDRIGVDVKIPLYQAGADYANVRAAKATARQRDQATIDTKQAVEESVTQGWTQLENATATIGARNDQIKAAEIAADGAKQEYLFGTRTLLDVLDAEQQLFSARTSLVRAQRDRIVAAYTLVERLGQLTPATLALKVSDYDPKASARDASWQPIGF